MAISFKKTGNLGLILALVSICLGTFFCFTFSKPSSFPVILNNIQGWVGKEWLRVMPFGPALYSSSDAGKTAFVGIAVTAAFFARSSFVVTKRKQFILIFSGLFTWFAFALYAIAN